MSGKLTEQSERPVLRFAQISGGFHCLFQDPDFTLFFPKVNLNFFNSKLKCSLRNYLLSQCRLLLWPNSCFILFSISKTFSLSWDSCFKFLILSCSFSSVWLFCCSYWYKLLMISSFSSSWGINFLFFNFLFFSFLLLLPPPPPPYFSFTGFA